MDVYQFRSQFPITRTRAYLFSGALGPAPLRVRAAWDEWTAAWTHDPNFVYDSAFMTAAIAGLRSAFAALIGAEPANVAITDNTSRAANLAVRMLAGHRGSAVVVDDSTYPSSVYPWMATTDKEVRYVPTDGLADPVGALAERIDEVTTAVVIAYVAPFTGRKHDVATLADAAHRVGASSILDAAQATGVVPIGVDRDGVDVLVTTAMKWMLGAPGVGFLYVSPVLLEHAPTLDIGYMGLDVPIGEWPPYEMPPILSDARRFELGLPNLPGMGATRAGIDLLMEVGIDVVSDRVEALVTRCIQGLLERGFIVRTPVDPASRAGVIAFDHPDPVGLYGFLRRRAVDVGGLPRIVRVDPHAFNDEDDIDLFLDGLDAYQRSLGTFR